MLMPLAMIPGRNVVPTIGPSILPSISSMTGASTFQPPSALCAKAEQGSGRLCARLGMLARRPRILRLAVQRRLRDALMGIGRVDGCVEIWEGARRIYPANRIL